MLRSTQVMAAFLDVVDQAAHAAQPGLVGVAADIDRLGVYGLAGCHAAHVDIDVEDQVAHLLHPAQRDAIGAERVALCWVQKVSNLILNINIEVRSVATGETVYAKSVDIRGNTDESWLRGVRRLVDNIQERNHHLR